MTVRSRKSAASRQRVGNAKWAAPSGLASSWSTILEYLGLRAHVSFFSVFYLTGNEGDPRRGKKEKLACSDVVHKPDSGFRFYLVRILPGVWLLGKHGPSGFRVEDLSGNVGKGREGQLRSG